MRKLAASLLAIVQKKKKYPQKTRPGFHQICVRSDPRSVAVWLSTPSSVTTHWLHFQEAAQRQLAGVSRQKIFRTYYGITDFSASVTSFYPFKLSFRLLKTL